MMLKESHEIFIEEGKRKYDHRLLITEQAYINKDKR